MKWMNIVCVVILMSIIPSFYCLDKLDRIIKKNPNHVIPVKSEGGFATLIPEGNRGYDVVLLIVVDKELSDKCPYCPKFRESFETLSKLFYEKIGKKAKDKTYWATLEYGTSMQQLASRLQLSAVPTVLIFKRNQNTPVKCDLQSGLPSCLEKHLKINLDSTFGGMGGQNGQMGRQGFPVFWQLCFIVGYIIIAILSIAFGIASWKQLKWKIFLLYISYGVFIIVLGGIVYLSINHSTPSFQVYNHEGDVQVFLNTQMRMLGAEGYIVSTTIILSALSYLLLTVVIPNLGITNGFTRRCMEYPLLALWILTMLLIPTYFMKKSQWYMSSVPIWGNALQILNQVFYFR